MTPIEQLGAPSSEFDEAFADGMRRRMAVSFHKYGKVRDGYEAGKVKAIPSLEARLARYLETGNTEFLIDAANFAMIEFMYPQHPDAHYRATDSGESPGRVHAVESVVPGASGTRRSSRANDDI